MRTRSIAVAAAVLGAAGCAGYNLQLGTSGYNIGEFNEVITVPATSLHPWTERNRALPVPPPPDDGSSGASTLPAARSALPPERPAASTPGS